MKQNIVDFIAEDFDSFMSDLFDATMQKNLGGFGGSKHFEITSFPAKFQKYILKYVDDNESAGSCFAEYLLDNGYINTNR